MSWDGVILAIGGILCLLLCLHGVRRFILGGTLARLKLTSLATIKPGLVLVTGKVAATQPLVAPLTQKDCIFYEGEVSQYVRVPKSSSKMGADWRTVFTYQQATPFQIGEGGSSVHVQPRGAEWEIRAASWFDVPTSISPIAFARKQETLATIAPIVVAKPQGERHSDNAVIGATEAGEWTLNVGDAVYLVGHYDGQAIVKKGLLLISDKPGSKYAKQFKRQGVSSCILGLLLVGAAIFIRRVFT